MYQAYEYHSSPEVAGDECSHAQRLDEDADTLKKYKALQNSVCFLCLLSLGNNDHVWGAKSFPSRDYIEVIHQGRIVRVQRHIDVECVLEEKLPDSLKCCPPACIGPVNQDLGVSVVDELDIFTFMECDLALGHGVLVDSRTCDVHAKGTIPGSMNIPYTVFHLDPDAPELGRALQKLGAKLREQGDIELHDADHKSSVKQLSNNDIWDFSTVKDIVLWCNGPLGQQSSMAIKGLQKLGYPVEKIRHYRGGMQLWRAFDLTTVVSD
jgi:rhodanese-related sulfurtransferase